MRLLFLIGNGFDINAGLDTSAKHFIEKYKTHLIEKVEKTEADEHEALKALLSSIQDKGVEYWSDFEKAFGEFSEDLEGINSAAKLFSIAFADFYDFFYKHIVAENTKAESIEITDDVSKRFFDGILSCFRDGMRRAQAEDLESVIQPREQWTCDFIVFNYTTILDRLVEKTADAGLSSKRIGNSTFSRALNRPLHIHGTLGDDHGLLIGVDVVEQLSGESCRADASICNWIIKPLANSRSGDLRQEDAFRLIDNAQIICVYGMSLGETDGTWWRRIANWALNANAPNRRLIINKTKPKLPSYRPDAYPNEVDKQKNRFVEVSGFGGLSEQKIEYLKSKILISLGTTCFDLFEREKAGI